MICCADGFIVGGKAPELAAAVHSLDHIGRVIKGESVREVKKLVNVGSELAELVGQPVRVVQVEGNAWAVQVAGDVAGEAGPHGGEGIREGAGVGRRAWQMAVLQVVLLYVVHRLCPMVSVQASSSTMNEFIVC